MSDGLGAHVQSRFPNDIIFTAYWKIMHVTFYSLANCKLSSKLIVHYVPNLLGRW